MDNLNTSAAPFGITPSTRLLGLLGYPVAHSLSPALHNACFQALGWNLRYLAFPVLPERLAQAVAGIRGLDLVGVNVTIPHKEAVLPFLTTIEPAAQKAGSVNTIKNDGGELHGYNTDGPAFLALLREEAGLDPQQKRIVILGTGGTARTVATYLKEAGAGSIVIAGRNLEKAQHLAAATEADAAVVLPKAESQLEDGSSGLNPYSQSANREGGTRRSAVGSSLSFRDFLAEAHLLVNCTSAGLYPQVDETPLDCLAPLPKTALVVDVIYNPRETRLMRLAKERGHQVVGGLGLLLRQASLAWEIWFGRPAPLEIMRQTAEGILSKNVE